MNFLEARCTGLACLPGMAGQARSDAPCAGPQRLCASVDANTSAPPTAPVRVALLLPLRSSTLATAAEAVHGGAFDPVGTER